ncbi:unnamed protein product [Boreogadus saida]
MILPRWLLVPHSAPEMNRFYVDTCSFQLSWRQYTIVLPSPPSARCSPMPTSSSALRHPSGAQTSGASNLETLTATLLQDHRGLTWTTEDHPVTQRDVAWSHHFHYFFKAVGS